MVWDKAKNRELLNILATLLIVAFAGIVRIVFLKALGTRGIFLTFYPAVMVAALCGGLLPGLLASVLSAFLIDYYIMVPTNKLLIEDTDQMLSLAIFVMSSAIISGIAEAMIRAKRRLAESERRLSISEGRLRMAIEAARLGAFDFSPQGDICFLSENAKTHFGLPHNAPVDCGILLARIHPDDRERIERAMAEPFRPESGGELDIDCRTIGVDDGKERWIIARGRVLYGETGDVIRLVGTSLDITALKEAEETLRENDRMLTHQSRLAAMGEMIGNIAHQWRQPLNTLGLIVQELPVYAKQGMLDQTYLEASVNKAMLTISTMSKTIDDFRDFLKPDKARVHFRVSEAMQKSVSLVEASFHVMGLQIQTVVDEEVSIEGCPNEYAQVILNLLVNAKDALLERKTERPLIVLRLFSEHGKAVLTVTDNAGGIPDAIMDKIFDPYFTTKGPDKGTGIGLYMSKAIIEKNLGGRLTVRNIGGGTEFRIEV